MSTAPFAQPMRVFLDQLVDRFQNGEDGISDISRRFRTASAQQTNVDASRRSRDAPLSWQCIEMND